jgi:Homeodomain-like domain
MELIAAGINDCEISRRLGIPRRTICDWRRPTYVPRRRRVELCPRCWRPTKPIRLTPNDYAELLGLYLGDGYISEGPRAFRLRITLDLRYPRVIEEARLGRSTSDALFSSLGSGS